MANPFNIHSNCYNGRLLVSLCIEVDNNQLSIQDYDYTQAPVLRHGNITITSDSLKKHLSAECLLLGVHNVAGVKRGRTRPLFEVEFTGLTDLKRFCKSLEEGTLQKKLHIRLQVIDVPSSLQLQVMAELHLIVLHNGEWQFRSVTSSNCQECFSLIAKSEVFKFTNFDLKTSILYSESILSIDDLSTLLCDLKEVAPKWDTLGTFLSLPYSTVEAIKRENSDRCSECLQAILATWLRGPEASPSRLVRALADAGRIALAKKVAGNFGISFSADNPSFYSNGTHFSKAEAFIQPLITAGACKDGIQLVEQDPSLEPVLIAERHELVANNVHYLNLTQTRKELQEKKENVNKTLADTMSKLEELNHRVNKLKSQCGSLAAERERKQAHRCLLQRESKHYRGQDLIILNEMIEDTVTKIKELTERMNELKETIAALEGEADQLNDKLLRQQMERDSLQLTLDDLNKKIVSAKEKLERDQMCHKEEIKRMLQEKKETDEKFQRQTIEIARQEGKIEEMRQDLKHRRDIDMALVSAGESPRTMTPIAVRKRNPDSGYYHDESSPTSVTKSSKCEIFSTEDEQRKSLSDLLATQKSNVNCLKVIVELRAVLRDIKSSGHLQLMTDHQVKCILLNIEDIYQFNKEILDSLQICVDNWRDWSIMSSILSRIVQNLEMYDTYFKGVKDAMLKLTELMDNQKTVDLALKSFEKKQDPVNQDLHWMLEPLAILPKFCGKLEGYYKCLPDDKALVVKGALSDITEHFHQEGVEKLGSFAEILTIKRTLKNCQGTILKPGRLFIKKGQLQKISRKGPTNRMFFLFSDVLLHTKPDGSQFAVRNEMPLKHMKVIEPEVSLHPHTFEVRSIHRSLILSASSEREKMHWMKCLNDAVRHHEQSSPSLDLNHNGFGCIAPVMVPDENTVMCQLCSSKFTFKFRRHHCYACGMVVCEKCSPNEVYLEYAQRKRRVCHECYRQAKGDTEMMLPQVLSPEAEDQDLLMRTEGESVMDGYVTVQEGLQEVRYWYVLTRDWTLKKYKAHEDIRAIVTIPLPGYVVTATIASNTIRLHHPTSDLQKIQITFKPVSGDYNDWVAKLEQATKLEEMTPVRRNSKSSLQNVEKSSVATSSSLLRSHTMPQTTSRKYATSRK